jgi:hypothetical protein
MPRYLVSSFSIPLINNMRYFEKKVGKVAKSTIEEKKREIRRKGERERKRGKRDIPWPCHKVSEQSEKLS